MAAKAVGGLAQKMIQTFVPTEQHRPILEFAADFNLASSRVADGYYVILGSQDPENPLPRPLPDIEVLTTCKSRLDLDGQTRGRPSRRQPRVSASDLVSLSLPNDLDVPAVIGSYAERVMEARSQLRGLPTAVQT